MCVAKTDRLRKVDKGKEDNGDDTNWLKSKKIVIVNINIHYYFFESELML